MTSSTNTSYVPTMKLKQDDLVRHMVTRTIYQIVDLPLVKYHDSEWVPGVYYCATELKEGQEEVDSFVRTREDFENKFIIVAGD